MVGAFSSPFNPLGALFPKLISKNTSKLHCSTLSRRILLRPNPQTNLRISSALVSSLATATPVFDLTTICGGLATPVVAKVATPPKTTTAISKIVVPEFCLALPKTKKRRGGGGGDDDDGGMGDGSDGGDYFGWNGDGDEDEENARRWSVMWTVMCVYSAAQTIYFLVFGKEEKHSSPLLATVTFCLCSRIQEKYLRKNDASVSPT